MRNIVSRFWRWFWSPSGKYAWGGIFIAGSVVGVVSWGGFNTFMAYTNTLDFCISCHEMERNVYQEYKKTGHYTNRTGVRVTCSDCHVPKEWVPMFMRKISATRELYYKAIGSIDTPEKFEARRLVMAERVWKAMEASDSLECRNCHSAGAMDLEQQKSRSRKKHSKAGKEGKTCIDCHKGVAHKLPEFYEEDD